MALTKTEFENISSELEARISEFLTRYPNNCGEITQRNYPFIFLLIFLLMMLLSPMGSDDLDFSFLMATGLFGCIISVSLLGARMDVIKPLEIDNSQILAGLDALESRAEGYEDVMKYCADNREVIVSTTNYKQKIDKRFRIIKRIVFLVAWVVVLPISIYNSDIKDVPLPFYEFMGVQEAPSFSIPIEGTNDFAEVQMICRNDNNKTRVAVIRSLKVAGADTHDNFFVEFVDEAGIPVPFFTKIFIGQNLETEVSSTGLIYKNVEVQQIVPSADNYGNLGLNFTRATKALQERKLMLRVRKVN